jgi:hypothetical protein
MHDDDAIGRDDFLAMTGDDRIEPGIGLQFSGGQQRRELLLIKIVQQDVVAVLPKSIRRRVGDGVIETSGIRMSEDD